MGTINAVSYKFALRAQRTCIVLLLSIVSLSRLNSFFTIIISIIIINIIDIIKVESAPAAYCIYFRSSDRFYTVVSPSATVSDLGVFIDQDLTMKSHISKKYITHRPT